VRNILRRFLGLLVLVSFFFPWLSVGLDSSGPGLSGFEVMGFGYDRMLAGEFGHDFFVIGLLGLLALMLGLLMFLIPNHLMTVLYLLPSALIVLVFFGDTTISVLRGLGVYLFTAAAALAVISFFVRNYSYDPQGTNEYRI